MSWKDFQHWIDAVRLFGQDLGFWASALGAAFVKVLTSEWAGLWRSLLTVGIAIFSAWAFTEPALDWLNLEPETYRIPMAAILALTGEGFMRAIIQRADNDDEPPRPPGDMNILTRILGGRK